MWPYAGRRWLRTWLPGHASSSRAFGDIRQLAGRGAAGQRRGVHAGFHRGRHAGGDDRGGAGLATLPDVPCRPAVHLGEVPGRQLVRAGRQDPGLHRAEHDPARAALGGLSRDAHRLYGTTIVLLTSTTNVHIFDGFKMMLLTMFMRTVVTFTTVADTDTGLARVVTQNIPEDSSRHSMTVAPCHVFTAGPLVEAIWWHSVIDDDSEHAYLRDAVDCACASVTGRGRAEIRPVFSPGLCRGLDGAVVEQILAA